MASKQRMAVAGLVISAAAFVGIVNDEWFTDTAVIPTKNDRPTVGFGSTFWEDGRPVKMGERITPVRAVRLASHHISKEEARLRQCLGNTPLHQHEYDAVVSWTYNVGSGAACSSTLVRKLRARDYEGACDELLKWKYVAGRELRGLLLRRERERAQCLGLALADNSQRSK